MTKITKLKTGSPFEDQASYSRLVCVDNWIYVSNTAGRNPQTKLIPEDVLEQAHQVFANIESALKAVDSSLADVVCSRVFIQDPRDVPAVMTLIVEKFRGVDPASTVTCPRVGRARPRICRSSTVLPVPEPPTSDSISPRCTVKFRSWCTVKVSSPLPNCVHRPCTSTMGGSPGATAMCSGLAMRSVICRCS